MGPAERFRRPDYMTHETNSIQKLIVKIRYVRRDTMSNKIKVELRNPHKWPLLPFAILAVLVLRLIRPWLLVRWSGLNSWRIGHFAMNTELHLCEMDAGINTPNQRYVDIFFIGRTIANQQLAKMWLRVHRVWPHWIHAPITLANRLVPGGAAHLVSENISSDRDVLNLLDRSPPHLEFTPEEESQGEAGLKTMGIPADTPFVCLIVRDNAYLDHHRPGSWRYHDYRDSDVQNYVLAAEELAERGYFVIRMGARVNEAINSSHPRVIDYATNGMRSDFMDIYLSAKCEFCISSACGFDYVPLMFRRPVASVNVVPIGYLWTSGADLISITRHYHSAALERDLTLREIFTQGAGFYETTADYESSGIQLIENTPEEVRDVAIEMSERQRDNWQSREEDGALQRRFWEIFPSNLKKANGKPLHGEIRSRYGTVFLRDNPEWLD